MPDNSRKTKLMEQGSSVTMIMPDLNSDIKGKEADSDVYLPITDCVGKYLIKSVIAENTGEATLYLAENMGHKYVLKLFHKNKRPKENIIEKIKSIQCKYVIPILDSGNFGGKFYVIMPYYKNGDISKNIPLNKEVLETIVIPSVNRGLYALHEKGIIHRDIKPTNIFISDDKTYAVIGDFGISSVIDSGVSVRATTMSRTLGYAAPETSSGFISKESDYYSFGITLIHAASGFDPFADMTEMQIMYQTLNKKPIIPVNIDMRLKKLILGLTAKDREERLGYREVENWLLNKDIEVKEDSDQYPYFKFEFMGYIYTDTKSLARAFAVNWKETEKYLYRGIIENYLKKFNEGMYWECVKLRKLINKNSSVFRLIYLFDSEAPLFYKGKNYISIDNLSQTMEQYDSDINEMILNGLLSYYLEIGSYPSSIIKEIDQYTEKIRSGCTEYYYAVKYLLDKNRHFFYQGSIFKNIDGLIDYLKTIKNYEVMEKTASDLIYCDKFKMWIFSLGYKKEIIQWQNIYENARWEDR